MHIQLWGLGYVPKKYSIREKRVDNMIEDSNICRV